LKVPEVMPDNVPYAIAIIRIAKPTEYGLQPSGVDTIKIKLHVSIAV